MIAGDFARDVCPPTTLCLKVLAALNQKLQAFEIERF
jgi:hypothetical protein